MTDDHAAPVLAFTRNELHILYRLVDQYQQQAERDLGPDDESHAVRIALREKITQLLYVTKEDRATSG